MKEGEGVNQRTCMRGPWTRTTVWLWPEGRKSGGWVEVGSGGDGDTCSSANNENKIKKEGNNGEETIFLSPLEG